MSKLYHTAVQLPLFVFKVCIRCGIEQIAEQFSKDPRYQDGRKSACQICHNAKRRETVATREHIPPPLAKVCSTCGIEQDIEQFYQDRAKPDSHEYRCKTCKDASDRLRHGRTKPRQKRQNAIRNSSKKWCYGCSKTKRLDEFSVASDKADGRNTRCRQCVAEHNHLNWSENGERYLAQHKEWYAKPENRLKVIELNRRRTAHIFQYDEVDYAAILERDGMWCYICEQAIMPDQSLEFDHVIPLSRKGPHAEDNIKPTHKICNRRKHDRLLEEMTPYQRRGMGLSLIRRC